MSRRDYGSGSISQRKDGTWTARMVIGTNENGKPKIKALYGKTEREVKRKLKEFQIEFYKNDKTIVQKNTVEGYIKNWLYTKKVNELKDKSFDRLEQTVMYQVIPQIGHRQIASLKADDIQAMVNNLKREKFSWSTVKKAYDAANECFRTGVEKRDLLYNPASGVSVPKKSMFDQDDDVRYYEEDEIKKLIETATSTYRNGVRHYRLGDLVPLCINTGLRNAELISLKWKDIDLDRRKLYVRSTRVLIKNRDDKKDTNYIVIEQDSAKTKSSIRDIDINQTAYDALVRLKEITGKFEYVLSTKKGNPVNPRFTDKTLRNIATAAGFAEDRIFGMHSLRHTFATQLFTAGEDVKTVSVLLGHSNTQVTYNTYIHVIDKIRKSAVNKIG